MMGAILHAVSVLILLPVAVVTIGAVVIAYAGVVREETSGFAPDK